MMQLLKNKKIIIFTSIIFIVAILSNISPIHEVFSLFGDSNHFRYSNSTGEFTFIEESKGRDIPMMNRWYLEFKKKEKTDTTLYRLFTKNPLAFWRIKSFFTDTKYKLPYKNWEEIERGKITDLARFQNF